MAKFEFRCISTSRKRENRESVNVKCILFLQLVIEVVSIQRNQFSIEEGKNTKEKTTNYAPLLIMQYQSKDISY